MSSTWNRAVEPFRSDSTRPLRNSWQNAASSSDPAAAGTSISSRVCVFYFMHFRLTNPFFNSCLQNDIFHCQQNWRWNLWRSQFDVWQKVGEDAATCTRQSQGSRSTGFHVAISTEGRSTTLSYPIQARAVGNIDEAVQGAHGKVGSKR